MKTQPYSEEQLRTFLKLYSFAGKKYPEIASELRIDEKTISQMYADSKEKRIIINKAKQLFNNKIKKAEFEKFKKIGQEAFYNWYNAQEKKCCYCGIEESKLKILFDKTKNCLSSKRGRGPFLELERINSKSNEYSIENCALACYFCNNHKSDIITAEDHKKYFAESIRKYIEDKFSECNK